MESNFNDSGEAEFYRRIRKEPPLDKHLLNANIQLQDENKELKDITKRIRQYVETSTRLERKKILDILDGNIE